MRKVHTFSKKRQPKSEQCQQTSSENKRGDTGLSNGTGPSRKLLRSTSSGPQRRLQKKQRESGHEPGITKNQSLGLIFGRRAL